jgi:5-methyltetrahydrofolate--homocysteine methyltransferase
VVDGAAPVLPESPRFASRKVEYVLRDFADQLDLKTLFSLNWRFGGATARRKKGHSDEELNALLEAWVQKATANEWVKPMGVFGLFPCQAEGDTLVLYDPEDPTREVARFDFTVVIGGGKEDLVSGAQYYPPKESGVMGVCGLQLTSSGPQVDDHIAAFKESGDSESTLFLQGLSDRIAEDMADHVNHKLCELLGVPAGQGTRWSPGYPGLRNILLNGEILRLLNGEKQLGVKITEAGEFSPTGSTGAIVSFHPEARYT